MPEPDAKNTPHAPSANETQQRERRAQALWVIRFFLFTFIAITTLQILVVSLGAQTKEMDHEVAFYSITTNFFLLFILVIFLTLNGAAEKFNWRPILFFAVSVRCVAIFSLIVWLIHIHIAGTSFTMLAMLIPFTALTLSWFLTPLESWLYLVCGTIGVIILMFLESRGILPFFPIITNATARQMTDLLDPRYLVIQLAIFIAFSIVTLEFVTRLRLNLQQRTQELMKAKDELEHLARTDALTNLLNRRTALDHLDRTLAHAARRSRPFALLMADLDNFKQINDTFGHAAGDTVLKTIADLFRSNLRPYDLISRIGGEEFLIIIPDADLFTGRDLAERARLAVSHAVIRIGENQEAHVTASFGVTALDPKALKSADELLKTVDDALYDSKRGGKDRVSIR